MHMENSHKHEKHENSKDWQHRYIRHFGQGKTGGGGGEWDLRLQK